MTSMPQALDAATTLDLVINFLSQTGIDNPTIWKHLDRTDRPKLGTLLSKLDSIEAEQFDKVAHAPFKKRQFEADKSARKGKAFEEISAELLAGLTCFGVRKDVTTDVNQLDVLVQLEPNSSIVPALRNWGSHFICECKFHDTAVSVTWVEKLHSILRTHNAKVGILISRKGIGKAGRARNIVHMLHLLAVDNTYIISLSREDLDSCVNGAGALEMIIDRYVSIGNGIPNFIQHRVHSGL